MLAVFVLALPVARTEPTCSGISAKNDCGYVGIDQRGCEAKGCCWLPAPGTPDPWCYSNGAPGPAPPSSSCFVTGNSGQAPFSADEIESMKKNFLANVNIQGSGAVVAAPDHNTGPGGDYYFHWERDGALTMITLQTVGFADAAILGNYSSWVAARQAMKDIHDIDVRTEPKYRIPNGEIFDGAWCRPQNDGPGLRATALILYAASVLDHYGVESDEGRRRLEGERLWAKDGRGSIQTSLDYLITGGWSTETCDLWEEVRDSDFFWNRITMKRALALGGQFARRQGDAAAAEAYDKLEQQIADSIKPAHVVEAGYLIEARGRQIDGAVIVGLNFNFDDPKPLFGPAAAEVAATVAAYNDAFCAEYPINRDAVAANLPGILYGRYPGDTYDGGNPWLLTTAALAQLLYRVGLACNGAEPPAAHTLAVWAKSLNAPKLANATGAAAAKLFAQAGDATLSRLAHYVRAAGVGFRLDEQIDKRTGNPTSAKSLTWSYAEVFNALLWRGKLAAQLAGSG